MELHAPWMLPIKFENSSKLLPVVIQLYYTVHIILLVLPANITKPNGNANTINIAGYALSNN